MSGAAIPVAAPGLLAPRERADVRAAIDRVLTSGVFVGGAEVDAFEAAFAASVGVGMHCAGVGSGLDALILSLVALDLPRGGQVLVPPNDGGYAALAVQAAGLLPVGLDVSDEGLVSLPGIQSRCGPSTVAVIATHVHGLAVHLDPVAAWCRSRSIALVEDCSQAHGARGVALHGDASAFSFYPTKNLGALGDAGAVLTPRADLADRIRGLREYGWGPRHVVSHPQGRNSRLDAVQAAVLRARLPYLARATEERRRIVSRYREAIPWARFLARDDDTFVAHHAVIVDDDRDRLMHLLGQAQIQVAVHYPALVAEMPGLTLHGGHDAPVAAALRDRQVSLPCFPGMSEQQVDRVCAVLTAWGASRG